MKNDPVHMKQCFTHHDHRISDESQFGEALTLGRWVTFKFNNGTALHFAISDPGFLGP